MQFEKVAQHYQQMDLATMPVIDYTLRLLAQCVKYTQLYREADGVERKKLCRKAQNRMFELMAVVDHDQPESKRLFQSYVYLNQQFVMLSLKRDIARSEAVEIAINEMIEAWLTVKKKRKIATDCI